MKPSGIITLLTDFGLDDAFVGIMKGVMLGINSRVHLVDLSHGIPPQHVLAGALLLRSAVGYFPEGTVHIAVVDPGVGSDRRALVIETERGWLIGPDNGVLSPAARLLRPRRVHGIENPALLRQPVSRTFHGRDVFAPAAAHVSRGIPLESIGPLLETFVDLDMPAPRRTRSGIDGEVVYVDHFGNLVTNIDANALASFPARSLSVSIKGTLVAAPAPAYASVTEGTPLSIVGSWGMLEIAVRGGSAAQRFAAGPGTPVAVVWE